MPITDSEKARRRRLLKAHYDVENSHDMSGFLQHVTSSTTPAASPGPKLSPSSASVSDDAQPNLGRHQQRGWTNHESCDHDR